MKIDIMDYQIYRDGVNVITTVGALRDLCRAEYERGENDDDDTDGLVIDGLIVGTAREGRDHA